MTTSFDFFVTPLVGDSAVGRDLSYDADFERLSEEVAKATSLAGASPDWRMVLTEGARILQAQSKDLRVATWVIAGAAFVDGWKGTALSLEAYAAMLDVFWETMHPPPKRTRARAGLVTWLWENLISILSTRVPTLDDAEFLRRVEEILPKLDARLATGLGDAHPGVGSFRVLVREKLRELPAPPPPPAAEPLQALAADHQRTPKATSNGVTMTTSPPERGAPVASLEEAERVADKYASALLTLAREAREASPAAAWPYRLARVSAWLTVDALPDTENGQTYIKAPSADERERLARMATDGDWRDLVVACEEALSEHRFWLDLHRMSALALGHLGAEHTAARNVVTHEVASLVTRLPDLARLLFSNGSPFASPETIEWLDAERGAAASAPGPSFSPTPSEAFESWQTHWASRASESGEALGGALAAASALATVRDRFRARLAVAKAALTVDRGELATALFERLLPEVDATLEAWEPTLSAEFLESYWKALTRGDNPWPEKALLVYRRLLHLHPVAALRLQSS